VKRLAVILLLCALAVTGCGSSSQDKKSATGADTSGEPAVSGKVTPTVSAGGTAMTTLHIEAAPNGKPQFSAKLLKAPAGKVQLVMTNSSKVPHNVAIRGHGVNVKGKVVSGGADSVVTVDLKPGQYEFYCSVDGHLDAGMRGLLNVGNASTPGG
jgi:uncharacterized cupredoxin-like copper-binding protein